MKPQPTLFSFFTKKPGAASNAATKKGSPSTSLTAKKKSAGGDTTSKGKQRGGHGGNTNVLDSVAVGDRIAVYWPEDGEYYPARVSAINRGRVKTDSQQMFTLVYDDGDVETVDLGGEKFKLLSGAGASAATATDVSQKKTGDEGSSSRSSSNGEEKKEDNDDRKAGRKQLRDRKVSSTGKRRRCIVERDGEETDEYEFVDEDDESESSSSAEEESDYEQSADDNKDDDDEELSDVLNDSDDDSEREKEKRSGSGKRKRLVRVNTAVANPYAKKAKGNRSNKGEIVTPPPSMSSFAAPAASVSITQSQEEKKGTFLTPTGKPGSDMFSNFSSSTKSSGASAKTASAKGTKGSGAAEVVTPCTTAKSSTPPPNAAAGGGVGGIPATGKWQDGAVNPGGTHLHNHLSFLYPPKLRDARGNPSTSPDYDPRTLRFGPQEEAEIKKLTGSNNITPAQRQWWELKSRYFDTVLFFKTGKFYELFHMDADIGVRDLGFTYMRGRDAHSGFPEGAYGIMSGKLVERGYKVARVEQTETPEQLQKRKKATKGKKPQVVAREVCSISSIGTRTYCFLDDTSCFDESKSGKAIDTHGPLLSIKEILLDGASATDATSSTRPVCEYGITVVDAVRSIVTVGQFADDALRSRLHTLLTTFAPSEILIEQSGGDGGGGASKDLLQMIKCTQTARVERIHHQEQFPQSTAVDRKHREAANRPSPCHPWDGEETVKELHRKKYFVPKVRSKKKANRDSDNEDPCSVERWPEVLRACVEGGANLALSSFGAVLFYLQRGLVDSEILGFGNIKAYIPPGSPIVEEGEEGNEKHTHEACVDKDHQTVGSGATSTVPSCDSTEGGSDPTTPAAASNVLQSLASASMAEEDGIDSLRHRPGPDVGGQNPNEPPLEHPAGPEKHCTAESVQVNASSRRRAPSVDTDHLQLDGTTIANLELLVNQSDQSTRNSLWAKINQAKSPAGVRLLRAWLLRPLFRKHDIERRMDAVEELSCGNAALAMSEARPLLSKVGDVERLLSRVHSMGAVNDPADLGSAHPNDRAVLYEGPQYTKRKVEDFRKLLLGLQMCGKINEAFSESDVQSGMLNKIVKRQSQGGCFPDSLEEELSWFKDNFDCDKAKKGQYEPARGMDEDYDMACEERQRIESELEQYKKEMCRMLGRNAASCWKYINTKPDARDKYLIELPVSIQVPADFYVKGKRGSGSKQVNKYRTSVVESLVQALEKAIDEQKEGKERGMQVVFAKFDSRRPIWASAAQATAMLDALGALAFVSSQPDFCRPEILDCDSFPKIAIQQGRHPCVDVTHNGGDFIPNDLTLGGSGDESRVLLLSGPNMGGKSTLLRQTCLIALLAQIGCFVPASSCSLTPLDRIFTRLGATDRILSGQSTFFVELAETAAALRGATCRSLVIMDELGRGTSTFDGTAIASATVQHLVEESGCLVLFATHYHSLLEDWKEEKAVRLGHMECLVEGSYEYDNANKAHEEANAASSPNNSKDDHNITFLYTLGEGACPRSFGINVAKLAGLPDEVLEIAKRKSSEFEAELNGSKERINENAKQSLLKKMKAAVESGDVAEAEILWEECCNYNS